MYWLLVWAGLLILVLYSPIGSPDLYSSKCSYTEYKSFVTKNGTILNSPKINHSDDFNSDDPNMPELTLETSSNYSVGNYQSTQISDPGSSYSSLQNRSYRDNNSNSAGQNGGGTIVLAGRSSRSSAGTSGVVMTNGITTLSTTSNLSNTTTKQSVTADDPQGGTDPGGDPYGDPIPLGDGWKLLILYGIVYTIYKTNYVQTCLQNRKVNNHIK